jgi:hypothetical protein
VGQHPAVIALETDLTTPLAHMWSRTDLDNTVVGCRPEQALQRANLMMFLPL